MTAAAPQHHPSLLVTWSTSTPKISRLPIRHLHPVFNVVKLSPAPDNLIAGRHWNPLPLPELIDGEEEYIVEEILNSRMFQRKLQYQPVQLLEVFKVCL